MRNIDVIRHADPAELADMLYSWIVRCSRNCPALSKRRDGLGCRQAILAWLMAEEE